MVERSYYNDFSRPLSSAWEVYNGPGHAGWGLRRPSAISLVAEPGAAGGSVLKITAQMGVGSEAGLLVSGGLKLTGRGQTYGRYTVRVRVEADLEEATSAVALLWPCTNRWPEGGEINIFETWGNRSTRSPVESHLHWPKPGATAPFTSADDAFTSIEHPVDGTRWHSYTLEWRANLVAVSVDGGEPSVLTRDPARIPHHDMDPTLQLDAFDTPTNPGAQPTLATPVSMYIDTLMIEP